MTIEPSFTLVERLAAEARAGYSLPRDLYVSDAVFAADMARVVSRKWLLAGHVSQIPARGDYFLFRVGDEQIIVIREDAETVRAFFNVCRHRGSTLCSADSGNMPRIVCPYHAWTYALDGSLLSARLMPDDFDKAANSLVPCHVRVLHGIIFVNMTDGEPDDFDATFGEFSAILDYHGIDDARIAHIGSYPTTANWKLVVENFFECYHCVPAHPEYCSMHPPEALLAFGAGPSSGPGEAEAVYTPVLNAWREKAAALGRPLDIVDDGPDSTHLRLLMHRTMREGFTTETEDGTPAAPLMGKRRDWDGGRMHLAFSPFSQLIGDNDFVVLFRFTPRAALSTDVDIFWLVDGKAEQVDVPKMIWGWDRTTIQDKRITEDNQAGIMSRRYSPGRYSTQERALVGFQRWYFNQFGLQLAS